MLKKQDALWKKHYIKSIALAVQMDPRRFVQGKPGRMDAALERDARDELETRIQEKMVSARPMFLARERSYNS